MFFYLSLLLFSGFHQLKSNFVQSENNSDYRGLGCQRKAYVEMSGIGKLQQEVSPGCLSETRTALETGFNVND